MNDIKLETYQLFSPEERQNFITTVANEIFSTSNAYIIKKRVRKTQGQVELFKHQAHPGRLLPVEELVRANATNGKVYLLCICDCGKWHICRTDAFKKDSTNGGCHSCGCLNQESLTKTIYNSEVQAKRIRNLKEYLSDKGIQNSDEINGWKITAIETRPCSKGTRKYIKGICPYCQQESQWIRADGIQRGAVHSCGCASESIGEQKIREVLELYDIPYSQEHTFDTCISPDTHRRFRWDFYIDDKYLIEFDGKQHFQGDGARFTEECVKQIKQRDKYKNQWAEENKIPLIRIPYSHKAILLEDLIPETSKFLVKGENDE